MTPPSSRPSTPSAPATPASTGHDHVDDAAFTARVLQQRDRQRTVLRVVRRFAPAIVFLVIVVVAAAFAVPRFVRFNCRSYASEARGNLQSLRVAQRAFHDEHDRYSIDPQALGWRAMGSRLRYSYFVRADKDGFEAVAIASGPTLGGDLWRIGTSGEIEHLIDGCR